MTRRDLINALLRTAVGVTTAAVGAEALARVGRPMTPTSVGGVRRRTRRRTRRRVRRRVVIGMTLVSLPYGCVNTVMRAGVNYHYCGGIWYRPQYQGTTVVYVVDSMDEGADPNVEFEEYEDD